MNDDKPLVSIGMPVYNEARWISQALEALLAQTFTGFELIISDNASTDETWEILQNYAARDARIILYRQLENIGAAENFEFVLQQTRGEYFMWAGGHDLWSANLLEVMIAEMENNLRIVLCTPQSTLIDESNNPITNFDEVINTLTAETEIGRVLMMHRNMKRCNAIYGLHRRSILMQTLPWPKVVGGDYILLIRIAILGHVVTNHSVQWFRRIISSEISHERIQHYISVDGLTGLSARFPYLTQRVIIMKEFLKAKGSFQERAVLLQYGLQKLFLNPGQPRLLIKEIFAGSVAALMRSLNSVSMVNKSISLIKGFGIYMA